MRGVGSFESRFEAKLRLSLPTHVFQLKRWFHWSASAKNCLLSLKAPESRADSRYDVKAGSTLAGEVLGLAGGAGRVGNLRLPKDSKGDCLPQFQCLRTLKTYFIS